MAQDSEVIIQLTARTESATQQVAKLEQQLVKTKVAARQVADDGIERVVKNGGAMGLLNDLTGGLAMQFKDAYESIQLTNTGLKGMRAALLATGIGAAVVAIGLLVSNWEEITKWIKSATNENQKYVDIAQKARDVSKEQVEALSRQENIMRLQGVSEEEILRLKIDALTIDKETLANQIEINKKALESLKINQQSNVEALGFLGKLIGLRAEETDEMREQQAAIDDQIKEYETLENTIAGLQIQQTENAKAAEEKRLEIIKNANSQAKEALKAREKDEIDSIDRVTQKQRDAYDERLQAQKEAYEQEQIARAQSIDNANQDAQRYLQESKKRAQDEAEYKANLQQSGFALAGQLNDLLFSRQGEQSKEGFRIAKALAISEAGLNTYKAASAAYATAAASPYTLINPAYPFIQAGIATAFGIAQVAKIASQKYGGGAQGGSGSAPGNFGGGSAPTPTNPQPAIDFSFLNQNQPAQTYVIAGDVKNANEANQKIKDQSVL